jgi:hypothetical protein
MMICGLWAFCVKILSHFYPILNPFTSFGHWLSHRQEDFSCVSNWGCNRKIIGKNSKIIANSLFTCDRSYTIFTPSTRAHLLRAVHSDVHLGNKSLYLLPDCRSKAPPLISRHEMSFMIRASRGRLGKAYAYLTVRIQQWRNGRTRQPFHILCIGYLGNESA